MDLEFEMEKDKVPMGIGTRKGDDNSGRKNPLEYGKSGFSDLG